MMEIRIDPDKPCDNRPVQVEHFRDGEWVLVGAPFKCGHEAAAAVLRAITISVEACVIGRIQEIDVLTLSDFRMTPVDHDDPQPTDLSQACEILKKIGEKQ